MGILVNSSPERGRGQMVTRAMCASSAEPPPSPTLVTGASALGAEVSSMVAAS
jgi:hypothetical protein